MAFNNKGPRVNDGSMPEPGAPGSTEPRELPQRPEVDAAASEAVSRALQAVVGPDLGTKDQADGADRSVVQAGDTSRAEALMDFYNAFCELDIKTVRHIAQTLPKMGGDRLKKWSAVLVAHDQAFRVIDRIV